VYIPPVYSPSFGVPVEDPPARASLLPTTFSPSSLDAMWISP
jgi:hypothetical protein